MCRKPLTNVAAFKSSLMSTLRRVMIDTQTDYRARSVDESQRISVDMRCCEYCVFPVPLSAVGWCHCGPTGPVMVSHAWPPSRLLTEAVARICWHGCISPTGACSSFSTRVGLETFEWQGRLWQGYLGVGTGSWVETRLQYCKLFSFLLYYCAMKLCK